MKKKKNKIIFNNNFCNNNYIKNMVHIMQFIMKKGKFMQYILKYFFATLSSEIITLPQKLFYKAIIISVMHNKISILIG